MQSYVRGYYNYSNNADMGKDDQKQMVTNLRFITSKGGFIQRDIFVAYPWTFIKFVGKS